MISPEINLDPICLIININIPFLFRSPDVTNSIPRPNLIPFTEPYAEGGSMHPGTRLKALQGTVVRKHPAMKPTSSTNEGKKD